MTPDPSTPIALKTVFGPPPFDPASQQMALPLRILSGLAAAAVSLGVIGAVLYFSDLVRADKGMPRGRQMRLGVTPAQATVWVDGFRLVPDGKEGRGFLFGRNPAVPHVLTVEKRGYLPLRKVLPVPERRGLMDLESVILMPDESLALAIGNLAKVREHLAKKDFAAASALCGAVLAIDPAHPEALRLAESIVAAEAKATAPRK